MTEKTVRIQDDLYTAVNGEWEDQAVIPDDKPATGGFHDLADDVEKTLMADFDKVAAGEEAPDALFGEAVKLYQLAKDFDRRDADGIAPELRRLQRIQSLQTMSDFNAVAGELNLAGYPLPFKVEVSADMADTTRNAVGFAGPDTILPDTTYYTEGNEAAEQLLAVYRDTAATILAATDLDADAQADTIERTLRFDRAIAARVKSSEEWSDYPAMYNPMPLTKVADQADPVDLIAFLNDTMPALPEQLIVYDPHFLETMAELFNADTFADYRAWAYLTDLLGHTGFLSDKLRIDGGAFGRALSGAPAAPNQQKHAYRLANSFFSEPIGVYYGRTYFGEKAKADVTTIVERMIETYKHRLQASGWLSDETKAKAIVKLDKMVLKMGYPDAADPIYSELHVDLDRSLLDNVEALSTHLRKHEYAKLILPVDRGEWGMPGHLVNACYDPSRNDITFPAAILQAPFYSLKQDTVTNLGGIGAVIAHEISHGFDNNGAKFDEYGNLANWWQPEDYAKFNELTNAMVAEFDGRTYADKPVNGKLIVSENIADAGGLAAALETAKQDENADLKAFFTNWARIWRMKARTEYKQLLLSVDVHAPNYLRANVQPQNLDDWYTTFDVKPEDGMYRAPADRIIIW